MSKAKALRDQLETALSDLLGFYSFTPPQIAVAILPDSKFGMSFPPEGIKVSGVELVFMPVIYHGFNQFLSDDLTSEIDFFLVLKQWDFSQTLDTAIERTARVLGQTSYSIVRISHVPNAEQSGILETATFTLRQNFSI